MPDLDRLPQIRDGHVRIIIERQSNGTPDAARPESNLGYCGPQLRLQMAGRVHSQYRVMEKESQCPQAHRETAAGHSIAMAYLRDRLTSVFSYAF